MSEDSLFVGLSEDLEQTFFRDYGLPAQHFEDASDPTPQFITVIFDRPFFEFEEGELAAARSQPPYVHTESRWGIAQDDLLDIEFPDNASMYADYSGQTIRFRVLRTEDDGTGVDRLTLQQQ